MKALEAALNMKPDFPVIDPKPGFRKTVANFNLEDYILRIGVVTIGTSAFAPSPLKVKVGMLAFLGSFSYAYLISSARLKGYFPNDDDVEYYENKKKIN